MRQSSIIGQFLNQEGYVIFRLKNGKCTPAARYVWQEMHGKIPEGYEIDHIDDDFTNNRPENLQLLSKHANNKKKQKRSFIIEVKK